jgi:enoyl-CoA hydratase/carnithine racemase
MTSGRAVKPAEAYELGMVDRLVPADELDDVVEQMAKTLAAGAPLSIRAIKRAVHDGIDRPLSEGLQRELEELAPLFSSEDATEGMTAFTEKREPNYKGQ